MGNEIKITGEVENESAHSAADLAALGGADRVDDVRALGSKREGAAARLSALLARARPKPSAKFVTLRSPSDGFSASVPLERVRDIGFVVYAIGGAPMTREQGGPFRFVIPDPAACQSDDLDECVNVKHLEIISLSSERGDDTRPEDEKKHAELHAHEQR